MRDSNGVQLGIAIPLSVEATPPLADTPPELAVESEILLPLDPRAQRRVTPQDLAPAAPLWGDVQLVRPSTTIPGSALPSRTLKGAALGIRVPLLIPNRPPTLTPLFLDFTPAWSADVYEQTRPDRFQVRVVSSPGHIN